MMKQLFGIVAFLSCLILFSGCSKDQWDDAPAISEKESSLNLVSPSKVRIATNIATLKNETDYIISYLHNGMSKDFEIVDIQFLPVSRGWAALIEYQTTDGVISNYLKASKDATIDFGPESSSSLQVMPSTRVGGTVDIDGLDGPFTIVCKGRCNGTDPHCSVAGSGSMVTCACNGCSLLIIQ